VGCGLNEAFVGRLEDLGTTAHFAKDALWWPARKIRLDASSMKPQDIENFLRKFNKAHPVILWGYAGAIDHVAFFAEQTSINPAAPKAVIVTSSPISEIQRNRIERVFHAPVYDQYGCCEVPWLAAQCRQKQGLHIFHGARLIEFTDDSGHPKAVGEVGNIVITDLENYGFPFIRYLVGDMGRSLPGRCRCGINLPLMDKVKGRQTDLVRLPNGTCLSGDYLTTIFDDFPDAVKAFQVRQKSDYSIKLRYIPGPDREKCSAAIKKVHDKLLEKTGFQVQITMEPTDFIPHDRGKLQYVISELA
jgi:phenylacetate-CoA ligase